MRWPGEARRAEQFARLLDDPGAPAEPGLAGLVAVAERLRDLPVPGPADDFRTRLRRRLLDEATERLPAMRFDPQMRSGGTGTAPDPATGPAAGPAADPTADPAAEPTAGPADEPADDAGEPTTVLPADVPDQPVGGTAAPGRRPPMSRPGRRRDARRPDGPGRPRGGQRRPRVGTGAVAMVLVVLAGVAIAGSRDALPGDPLYGIKRGTENAQLVLARGDEHRGLRYLGLARTRLQEVTALAGRGEPAAQIVQTLDAMDQQTTDGVQRLTTAAVDQVDDGILVQVGTWTAEQYRLVTAAVPQLPTDARSRATESVALLRQVGGRVLGLRTRLGCGCLATTGTDQLGPKPCNPCASGRQPAGSTSTSQPRPTGPAGPARTATPAPTTSPPAGRPSGGGTPGGGSTGAGSSGGRGGGGGLPIPLPTLPLPTSGGNVPLPTIPGLPLPTSLPIPLPTLPLPLPTSLPTLPLPLPTGLLPGVLPGS